MSGNRHHHRSPKQSADEEEIHGLFARAGHRPAVPEKDLAMIRAAARAEWQGQVAARRRRVRVRRLVPAVVAAGLVLALGAGWWWSERTGPVAAAPIATVELVKGDVWVREAARGESVRRRAPAVGDPLVAGMTLTTGAEAEPGIVALTLADGASVRLHSDTRVWLLSRRRLALETGTLYADSGVVARGGEGLAIDTAWGNVRDVGTQFEVRVAADEEVALRVRVREGRVTVASGGTSHTVVAGRELRMRDDRTVSRRDLERHGAAWDWTLAAAPAIDIEGLKLSSFLAWACRETGWELRYADADATRAADEIRLRGTIEGLTPDQAVRVVLPGSRFDSRLEGGTLTVFRTPG